MSLRDDFQPRWKLLLKWGWLSFAVFILMAPVFYTMYISFNELGFGAKYYIFTFQWYENVFSDRQLIGRSIACQNCLLYTSPSPRDATLSRMPSSA